MVWCIGAQHIKYHPPATPRQEVWGALTTFLDACLPLLLRLARQLLQAIRQGNSNSGSQGTGTCTADAVHPSTADAGGPAAAAGKKLECLTNTVKFIGALAIHTIYPADPVNPVASPQAAAAAAAEPQMQYDRVWESTKILGEVMTVYEDYVRLQASNAQPNQLECTTIYEIGHQCMMMPPKCVGVLALMVSGEPQRSQLQLNFISLTSSLSKLSMAWDTAAAAAMSDATAKAAAATTVGAGDERYSCATVSGYCRFAAANACVTMLSSAVPALGGHSGPPANTDAAAAAAAAAPSTAAAGQSSLPWLVLLARCCLLWGLQLQAALAPGSNPSQQQQQQQVQQVHVQQLVESALGHQYWSFTRYEPVELLFRGSRQQFVGWAATYAHNWLTNAHVVDCLGRAGYDVSGATVYLGLLVEKARLAAAQQDAATAVAALPDLAQLLCSFGTAACDAFAVPELCNNPSCVNISGGADCALVLGRSCMCGGCRVAHYCSRVCQRAHWKRHNPVCGRLAAAAAAASTADASS